MTTWQTEIMEENARNQVWEELNASDPAEDKLIEAAGDLDGVCDSLWEVMNNVGLAMATLTGTPEEYKLDEIVDLLDDIMGELKELEEHWKRGERK